jgi:hypothetical protein
VIDVIDEDAPEEPGRQQPVKLRYLEVLLCDGGCEESHVLQFERGDLYLLLGQGQVRGRRSISAHSLQRPASI